jgi:hypothetical protein
MNGKLPAVNPDWHDSIIEELHAVSWNQLRRHLSALRRIRG